MMRLTELRSNAKGLMISDTIFGHFATLFTGNGGGVLD
jgi:hypothetical protein